MHAKRKDLSFAKTVKKLEIKKEEEDFDACNALEDQYTMVSSSPRQPWAAEFITKAPLPLSFRL